MKITLYLALVIVTLAFNTAQAVIFTPGSIPKVQTVPLDMPGASFDIYENDQYLRFALYGYRIQTGTSFSFDWVGDFWSGSVALSQEIDSVTGEKGVSVNGFIQHIEGLEYGFETTGGRTGDPFTETIDSFGGERLIHNGDSDLYNGRLNVHEGMTFNSYSPVRPAINRVGWLLDIRGVHGQGAFIPGPAFIMPAPLNVKAENQFFNIKNQVYNVPEPVSLALLMFGLGGLFLFNKRKNEPDSR